MMIRQMSLAILCVGLIVLGSAGQTPLTQPSAAATTSNENYYDNTDCSHDNLLRAVKIAVSRLGTRTEGITLTIPDAPSNTFTATYPSVSLVPPLVPSNPIEQLKQTLKAKQAEVSRLEHELFEREREAVEIQWIKALAKNCGQ